MQFTLFLSSFQLLFFYLKEKERAKYNERVILFFIEGFHYQYIEKHKLNCRVVGEKWGL